MIRLLLLLMLAPIVGWAQLDQAVDSKIKAFGSTLDSSINIVRTVAGNFHIDTLTAVPGEARVYQIRLIQYGPTVTVGVQIITVINTGGTITTLSPTSLRSGPAWLPVLIPGIGLAIRCNNTSSTNKIKWDYKRMNL